MHARKAAVVHAFGQQRAPHGAHGSGDIKGGVVIRIGQDT